ncbi:hypothetical protein [Paraburkholderia metrosideri]|uniref:Uncharacterized protein n=1 Tax=Paraburkholderia metrosideri TaxID=580937 RepID=A0ABM8P1N6_9BURK|nr:hypothetical protein [Paraburkholderia metrosideri]CAD6553494.1 hypothetical protein LMG28140_05305 [Paraburkholderia metrosideri]
MSTNDEKSHLYRPDARDYREIIAAGMSDESRAAYAEQVAGSGADDVELPSVFDPQGPHYQRELAWSELTAADIPGLIDAFDHDDDDSFLIQHIAFLALAPALRQGLSFSDAALAFTIASEERKMLHVLPASTAD